MSDHQCTWLKVPRETVGFTQESLAFALEKNHTSSARKIRYWENCIDGRCGKIPFPALAQLLGVDEEQLRKNFKEDEAICRAEQMASNNPADPNSIESAINDCFDEQFKNAINKRCKSDSIKESSIQISGWIDEGNMSKLSIALNDPLSNAIKRVTNVKELECIRYFIEVVILNSVAANADFETGGSFDATGSQQAWVQLLRLNKALDFSLRKLQAKNKFVIDDDSVRHCKIKGSTKGETPKQRLWEIVNNLATILEWRFIDSELKKTPHPDEDSDAFDKFCNMINRQLLQTNGEEENHIFSLFLKGEDKNKDEDVLLLIDTVLPNLRRFLYQDLGGKNPALNFDEGDLESWIARGLYRIEERKAQLHDELKNEDKSDADKIEDTFMSYSNTPKTNIQFRGDGATIILSEGSGTHTNTINKMHSVVLNLKEILEETNHDKANYPELRGETRKILGEIDDTGKPPTDIMQRLKKCSEHLEPTSKVVKIIADIGRLIGVAL